MTAPARDDRRRRLRIAIAAALGGIVLRVLGLTWRIRTRGGEPLAALRASRTPCVIVLWHGELLPTLWQHRGEGIAALVSQHADGEIIARILLTLGCRTVRGSTTRGGARALLALVRELEAGHDVAVTPDGPRGPRHSIAPGALVAAQRAGAPIVAFGATVDRAWRLRSWDRFVIPKPFARITIAYSAPLHVEAPGAEGLAEALPRVARALAAVSGSGTD